MSNIEGIIDNFTILVNYYKKTRDHWRQQAYQNAIRALKTLQVEDITKLEGVKGIGKETKAKINEYLTTGQIRKVEEVKLLLQASAPIVSDKELVINKFQNIEGVGPSKALALWDAGIHNLDSLRANTKLLTKAQKIGLDYYDDLQKRIPRDYIYIFQLMCRYVLALKYGKNSFTMVVAGSYRRGAKTSGDIDFLITSKVITLDQIVTTLKKWNIIVATLSQAKEKFMGIAHCPNGQWFNFHLDIVFLPEEYWGAGLLWFTGSKGFNISVRAEAKKLGYTLNQKGLYSIKTGQRVPVFTEEEILNHLGMQWIAPEKR